jgi:hypothetical protein
MPKAYESLSQQISDSNARQERDASRKVEGLRQPSRKRPENGCFDFCHATETKNPLQKITPDRSNRSGSFTRGDHTKMKYRLTI